jgi:ABC-type nitrate/sulfonate/bicarbonate transport system substrate-binding protein
MKVPRSARRTLAIPIALAALAATTTLAACGGDSESTAASGGGDLAVVKPLVIQGTQLFPIKVMQDTGIAAKHHLKVEPQMMAGPEALYTRMLAPGFQVGFGAWAKIAQLRAAGHHLVNVFSMYGYTNDVLVKNDSPYRSLADLKGKRVGQFGGPGAGTTLMYRLEAKKFFGYDPQKDAQPFFGAPGLLAGQLGKGQLDGALLLDPVLDQLLLTGQYRSIGNLGQIWRQRTGQSPMLVSINMNEDWANANPQVARNFVAAYSEAQKYIKTHPQVWKGLAASVGIKDPKGVALLRKRVQPALLDTWGPGFIQQQLDFAKTLVQTFGPSQDFPSEIPSGTFTTKFAPASGAS